MEFQKIYDMQVEFQRKILAAIERDTGKSTESWNLPRDDQEWFGYHVRGIVEELGEVMKSDKRWKTHRNNLYDPDEKTDEIADVIITAINLAIFSGITSDSLVSHIAAKICSNTSRFAFRNVLKQ